MLARSLLVAVLVAGGACSGPGVLVAPTGEHRLTARDEPSGLTVMVTTGVWPGDPPDLAEDWTVLHVLVANLGSSRILLAPGDFELRDERGFQYELIDPGATFHRVDADPRRDGYGRQYRRDYDPGGPIEFTPMVPPGDVGRLALPWGVLEPGTQMRGFVYFEPMTMTANGAELVWRVTTPEHARVVDLRFDFVVARPSAKKTSQANETRGG